MKKIYVERKKRCQDKKKIQFSVCTAKGDNKNSNLDDLDEDNINGPGKDRKKYDCFLL